MSEHDVDLIAARLRAELSAGAAADGTVGEAWTARAQAERFWPVTADRPFLYKPDTWGRIRGTLLVPPKLFLRKLMRWYVEPAFAQQRDFNSSALKAIDELSERLDEGLASLHQRGDTLEEKLSHVSAEVAALARTAAGLERSAAELDERLLRAERRTRGQGTPTATPAPAPASAPEEIEIPDYFAFEARMRSSRDAVRERQSVYVDDFRAAAPVLDLGCGRGEFLELMRETDIEARGVDIDGDMVEQCRAEGLAVEVGDALAYLAGLEDGSLGGIFSAHVVEHLKPATLFRMLELGASKLRRGGVFVAETPNPLSLVALAGFWADLSHQHPVHPETLSFLMRQAGFKSTEVRYLHPPPAEARLQYLPDEDDAASTRTRPLVNANFERLNDVVFGPQDYAILART